MPQLYLLGKNENAAEMARRISADVQTAVTFLERAKGLLGKKEMGIDQCLWIKPCNNVHTFFMKFSIDCIFMDKSMKVVRTFENVAPHRLVGPVWKASSVLEAPAGFIGRWNIKNGDQLHVVD
jgi:uncharacterized protein